MRRREFLGALGSAMGAWSLPVRAQQPALPTVGFLYSRGADDSLDVVAAFGRGLREGGVIDGQNVKIEYRWAQGRFDRLPALAQELARMPLAVLVAGGGDPVALAAKAATSSIPIVFAMGGDPIKLGFAASYNQPGGNATGINFLSVMLEPKRLGLLRDLVPAAETIGFLFNSNFSPSARQISDAEEAARAIGLRLKLLQADSEREIDAAFEAIVKERIHALAVAASPFFDTQRTQIVALAARHKVPAIYQLRLYVHAGGLMSYGVDAVDIYRQVGLYTAKIIGGAKPGNLPILWPTKFEFVINLKTAKAIGLVIPPGLLAIADDMIE
jgi:putative ABC transport system substrate-binding protein